MARGKRNDKLVFRAEKEVPAPLRRWHSWPEELDVVFKRKGQGRRFIASYNALLHLPISVVEAMAKAAP
jgi:hypothetical protein